VGDLPTLATRFQSKDQKVLGLGEVIPKKVESLTHQSYTLFHLKGSKKQQESNSKMTNTNVFAKGKLSD